jgi:hypothetical protein
MRRNDYDCEWQDDGYVSVTRATLKVFKTFRVARGK